MRYIELNPVRANMVSHPKEYPWSSYCCNALGDSSEWLKSHWVYQQLGGEDREREKAYRALFRHHLSSKTIGDIRSATNKGWVLGADRFRKKIEKLASRRVEPLPKGRPRKV